MATNKLPDLVIRSRHIVTCSSDAGYGMVDGYIAVADGLITEVMPGEVPEAWLETAEQSELGQANRTTDEARPQVRDARDKTTNTRYINARDKTVLPGFIDAHTHMVHAGSRERELAMKLAGTSYLDILAAGGGIHSTVQATRAASADELFDKSRQDLDAMLLCGTTTIEAKSGYGLDLETERKCLQVAKRLDASHPIDIISTYMGAHAVPKEYRGDTKGYRTFMIETVMPAIWQEELAEFVDVFCEEGVFSPEETRELLQAAKELGFKCKLHADEIVSLGGAELAAELYAVSADHLLAASDTGIRALANAGVTAVVLPGTSFYLMTKKFARARALIDAGVRVAIATDYNPGSCPCLNLQTIIPLACFGMQLSPEEVLRGMTINAAHAINRQKSIGSIEPGKQADIVLWNAPNPDYLVYRFGENLVETVIKKGHIVVEHGRRK